MSLKDSPQEGTVVTRQSIILAQDPGREEVDIGLGPLSCCIEPAVAGTAYMAMRASWWKRTQPVGSMRVKGTFHKGSTLKARQVVPVGLRQRSKLWVRCTSIFCRSYNL